MPEVGRKFLAEVLNLDPKKRPTPDKMLNWSAQLKTINTEVRHLSPAPFQNRDRNPVVPLR